MSISIGSTEPATGKAASDTELVARAQAGDSGAFEELVRRHEQKVKRVALYLCHGHAEDGEETAQNALLNAYRYLRGFRGESQFSTWLTRIVINSCRMYQRRQRNLPRGLNLDEHLDQAESVPVELVDGSDDPEEQYTREEFQAILQRRLADMKELYRKPFVLTQIEGLSNEEMAARLGVSVATAKTRLLRARRRLQRDLAETFCRRGRCYWPGAGPRASAQIQGRNSGKRSFFQGAASGWDELSSGRPQSGKPEMPEVGGNVRAEFDSTDSPRSLRRRERWRRRGWLVPRGI